MVEQSQSQLITGAHPTNREFVEQLTTWGFRARKEDGVHTVFRGPHGGTLRVVRSLLGRVDADRVAKAARLLHITTERFWTGPSAGGMEPAVPSSPSPDGVPLVTRDQVTSLVLGAHAAVDRPLGFSQVVEILRGQVTRDQVRTTSAQLCREGDLHRIRAGVYQWANGARAHDDIAETPAAQHEDQPMVPRASAVAIEGPRITATQLFDRLFPAGVHMTAELLADFERWAELTEKLAAYAEAS